MKIIEGSVKQLTEWEDKTTEFHVEITTYRLNIFHRKDKTFHNSRGHAVFHRNSNILSVKEYYLDGEFIAIVHLTDSIKLDELFKSLRKSKNYIKL